MYKHQEKGLHSGRADHNFLSRLIIFQIPNSEQMKKQINEFYFSKIINRSRIDLLYGAQSQSMVILSSNSCQKLILNLQDSHFFHVSQLRGYYCKSQTATNTNVTNSSCSRNGHIGQPMCHLLVNQCQKNLSLNSLTLEFVDGPRPSQSQLNHSP